MRLPLLLLAAALAVQDGESERPWNGLLPDPDQEFGDEEHRGSDWLATRILDAATGQPIPGARLLRTPEWIDESRLRHDMVMSEGIADADGIARVPADGHLHRGDSHWLAVAPGYAPTEDYGPCPDPEMLLARGIPMSFRVLDPLGRPVQGAVLEFLGGCSHGTAGARAVAGADGVATFSHLEQGSGQLWVYGPGIESDLRPLPDDDSLGTRPDDLVTEFGSRYEGRVVDLLGEPVPGCVVRAYNEQRGPTAMTGLDGRFVLEGAEGAHLTFFPAVDLLPDSQERWIDDVHPGTPFTVVSTSAGVIRPERTATVVVRARDPGGKPVADVSFALVHRESGRGPGGTTEEEEGEDEEVDVAPGTYRVLPDDPFGAYTFDPAEVRAAAGETAVLVLPVRPQARLRIRGEFPESADLTIAVEGTEDSLMREEDGWSPAVPARGTAVLRVEVDERPPFFFPVGPEKDGFREVVVELPAPRRFPVPPGAKDARLLHGTRAVLTFEEGGFLCTDASGPLMLRWKDRDGITGECPAMDRPGAGVLGRTVVRTVTVRALGTGEDGKEAVFHEEETEPGEMVVVDRAGWRTLRVVAPERDLDLRWGTAALRLTLLQDARIPADPLVLVDGEVYDAPGGVLHLRGLEPGPHRVVAAIRDEVGGGRELRLVLKEGETRERTVTLGEE